MVATAKTQLDHIKYNGGAYDTWYYKMYFLLLDPMISPIDEYRVFIDIKDTLGGPKVKKLNEVLCNNIYDFKQEVVKDVKQVNSKQSEILQLVDLFIAVLTYYHRGLNTDNTAKTEIVN